MYLSPMSTLRVLLLLCAPLAPQAYADGLAQALRTFNIPAGSLDETLKRIASAGDIYIIFSSTDVANFRAGPVMGRFGVRQALAQALDGTGYTALEVAPSNFVLRRIARAERSATSSERPSSVPAILDAVQVTGSRISRSSLQGSFPVSIISRDEILASGQLSVAELLSARGLLRLHRTADVSLDSGAAMVPLSGAAGASLYELGPRATLVLLNGKRLASAASIAPVLGSLADMESIPTALIDRIEIMNGGGSAIYGADAMSGVVNVVLRDQMDGVELSLSQGLSDRGDASRTGAFVSAGGALGDDGHLMLGIESLKQAGLQGWQRRRIAMPRLPNGAADPRYYLGPFDQAESPALACPSTFQGAWDACLFDRALYTSVAPQMDRTSASASYRQTIGGVTLSATVVGSANRVDVTYPPTILHLYDNRQRRPWNYGFFDVGNVHSHTSSLMTHVTTSIQGSWGKWDWDISGFRSENSSSTRILNLLDVDMVVRSLSDGSYVPGKFNEPSVVDSLRAVDTVVRGNSRSDGFALTTSRQPASFAGESVALVFGVEGRRESLNFRASDGLMRMTAIGLNRGIQPVATVKRTSAIFGELNLAVSDGVSVDLAARLDSSPQFGRHLMPRLGVKWDVGRGAALRASLAGGYREPSAFELRRLSSVPSIFLVGEHRVPGRCSRYDVPRVNGSRTCVLGVDAMANPELKAEHSSSAFLGLLWGRGDSWFVSADRYRFVRTSEIRHFDVQAQSNSLLPQDLLLLDQDGAVSSISVQLRNRGRSELEGWNVEARHHRLLGRLQLDATLAASAMTRLTQVDTGRQNLSGRTVPKVRVFASAQVSSGAWKLQASVRYRSALHPISYAPRLPSNMIIDYPFQEHIGVPPRVPSMTTFDLAASLVIHETWELALGVSNVTDRQPVNVAGQFNGQSVSEDDPIGRYWNARVTYRL